MLLYSPLLRIIPGVRHGFSTRLGGTSTGSFGTLNLGRGLGDDDDAVSENRSRFMALLDQSGGETSTKAPSARTLTDLVELSQVHGAVIRIAPDERGQEGDAIVTVAPRIAVGVRTADCAPILVACLDSLGHPMAVAAIHAGWRSAALGIVARTLERLEALGAKREHMRVALGPCIGVAAFEVGEEVMELARASLGGRPPPFMIGPRGRPHLDLQGLVEAQLLALGIEARAIDRVGGCTHAHRALYFSHRRDGGVTGRHLSAIGFVAP